MKNLDGIINAWSGALPAEVAYVSLPQYRLDSQQNDPSRLTNLIATDDA